MMPHEKDLLAVKMEEGATSQGVCAASRSPKRQENGFAPGASRRDTALDLSPVRLPLDLWPPEH